VVTSLARLPVSGKAVWTDSGGFVHTASGHLSEGAVRAPPSRVGHSWSVSTAKFSAPDPSPASGFLITDLDGADAADGVVRCAKKVLMDGARTMARSRTYAWALLEQRRSGASVGISAAGDREGGIAAFLDAVGAASASGTLVLDAAKGVGRDELGPLRAVDPRHDGDDAELLATSLVASLATVPGGLEGRTVGIEGAGSASAAIVRALAGSGARPTTIGLPDRTVVLSPDTDWELLAGAFDPAGAALDDSFPAVASIVAELPTDAVLSADVDVLVCGSKLGLVDHDVAAAVSASVIAPVGPAPVTAKGLAVAGRNGVLVLPDFLTTAGPLQRFLVEGPDAQVGAARSAAGRCAELAADPRGAYLGACVVAESFLSSWRDELPFGRPLA